MIVRVAFFAAAKDITDHDQLEISMDDSSTVADVQYELGQRYPELLELIDKSTWSLDHAYVTAEHPLHHGAEIGLIPPVSGG